MLLAIDSSSMPSSVAFLDGFTTIAEFTINYKKTHSQTLLPLIEKMCELTEIELEKVDVIACAQGPGSFTGLRIGAATAQGLAFGLGVKIVPIPTLDSLAYNIFDNSKLICPIMDARCNQVYTAIYKWENKKLNLLTDYLAVDINVVINKIIQYDNDVIFLGDGVNVHKNTILQAINNPSFALPNSNAQRASSLGTCAQLLLEQKNCAVNPDEFILMYLRRPQAQRECLKETLN